MIGRWISAALRVTLFPLEILYFHGPRLFGHGFQEGVSAETICSEITGVRSEFWTQTSEAFAECEALLRRKFYAFAIGCVATATLLTFLNMCYLTTTKHFLLKPLTASISKELAKMKINVD